MSDQFGFAISCRRCGGPATVTNPPWHGPTEAGGANARNVEIACADPRCDQPGERGAIRWWASSTPPALVVDRVPPMLRSPDAPYGAYVSIIYAADGSIDIHHHGFTYRGRSEIANLVGKPRAEVPLGEITYRFVDEDAPGTAPVRNDEHLFVFDPSSAPRASTWNPRTSPDASSLTSITDFIARHQGGRLSAMTSDERRVLETLVAESRHAGVSIEVVGIGRDPHGKPQDPVPLNTACGAIYGTPDLLVIFRGSLPGCLQQGDTPLDPESLHALGIRSAG